MGARGRESPRDVYRQLSHPIRRQIISLLGSREQMSATTLMNELDLSPGNFYYHLGFINPLIYQKQDGAYTLNDEGRTAYARVQAWDAISEVTHSSEQIENRFFALLCLGKLGSARCTPLLGVASFLAILELIVYTVSNVMPRGLFVEHSYSSTLLDILLGYGAGLILFILTMSSVFAVIKKKTIPLKRLIAIYTLIEIPLAAFSVTVPVLASYQVSTSILNIVFLGFQAWSVMILVANLSRAARVSLASAALASLLLVYINLAILFFNIPFFLVV